MANAFLAHWPEYLIEAALLATFMMAACAAVLALEHPRSPLARRLTDTPALRRLIAGTLMGVTAVALIYSPWGRRSGAHMNPATTLAYLALGVIRPWDAAFYAAAQFLGGLAGVAASAALFRGGLSHERVRFAATRPGPRGPRAAWTAEFIIAFGMMMMVLISTNNERTAPYTGLFAGALVAFYIAVEAPLSGMSMNPARSLGSAVPARATGPLWIYFTAPPLAMLAAAAAYSALPGVHDVYCGKLEHDHGASCLFNCRIAERPGRNPPPVAGIQAGPGPGHAPR